MLTDATAGVSERYRARQLHLAKEEVQRCRATALADLAARLSAAQAELRAGDSRLPARKCDASYARYAAVLTASQRVHALEDQIARLRAVAAGGDGPASPRTLCEVSLATPATLADPEAAQASPARQQQQQERLRRSSGDEAAAAAAAPYERLLEIRAALRAKAQLPAVRRGVPVASAAAAAACRDALERRARWGGGGSGGGAAEARGEKDEEDRRAALREAALRLPTGGSGGGVGLWVSWTPELVSAAPGRFGGFVYEDEGSIAGRLTSLRLRDEGYALCVAGRAASGKTACVLRLAAGARLQAHFDGGVFVAPAERCTERLAGLMQRALGGGGDGSDLSAATEAALLRVVRTLARGRRILLVVDGFDAGCGDAASAASLDGAGGAALQRLRSALAAHGPTGSKLVATVRVDGRPAGERGSRRRAEAAAAVSMPNASVAGSGGGEAGAALCLPAGVLDALAGGVFEEVHGMAWSSAMAVQLLAGVAAGGGDDDDGCGFPEPQLAALFEALRGSGAAAVLAAAAAREFAPLLSPEAVAQRLRQEAEAQAARTLLRRTPPVERTAFELLVDAVVDALPAAARVLLPALAAVRGDGGGVPVAVLEGLFAEGAGGEMKNENACCAGGLLVLHRLHFVTVFVGDGGGDGGGDLCFCVNPVVASYIRRAFADDATAFHARIAERLIAWRWGCGGGGSDGDGAATETASEAMRRYVDMHVVEHLARGGVSGDDAVAKLLRVEVLQAYTGGESNNSVGGGAARYLALLEQVARSGCRAACQLVAALKHGRHGGGDAGSFLTFFHSRLRAGAGEGRRLRAVPAVAAFSKALSLRSIRAGAAVLSAKRSESAEVGSDEGAFLWAKSLGCFCVAPSATQAVAPAGEGSLDVTRGVDLRSVVSGADGVAGMCVTADRRRVLAVVRRSAAADSSARGSLVVLRVQDMAVVEDFALPEEATCVAASPVAPAALVGDAAGGVTEWRTTRPLLRRSAAAAAVAVCQARRPVQDCADAGATAATPAAAAAAVTFVAYAGGGGDGVVCVVHASGRAAFLAKTAEGGGEAEVLCEGRLGVKEPRVWPAAGRRLFLYGGRGGGCVVGGFFLKDGGLRVVPDLFAFGVDEDEDGGDGTNAVVSLHVADADGAAGADATGKRGQRGVAILASGRVEPFVLEEDADGGWSGTVCRDAEGQKGARAGVAPAACGGCAAVQLASGGVVRVTPRSVELWGGRGVDNCGEAAEAATVGSGGGGGPPRLLSEWPAEGCSAACALDGASLLVARGAAVWVVECRHAGVAAEAAAEEAAPRLRWCEWGGVACAAAVEGACAPRYFEAGASTMEVVPAEEAEERRARRGERRRRQEARGVGVGSGARLRVAAAGVVRASLAGPVEDARPSQQHSGEGGWRVVLLEEAGVLQVSWREEEEGRARWQLQVQAGGRVEDYLLVDTTTGLTLLGVCAAGWVSFFALVVHRRRLHGKGHEGGVQYAVEEGGGGGGIPVSTGTRLA